MKRSEKLLLSVFAVLFIAIVGGGLLTIGVKNYQAVQAENERLKDRLTGMATAIAQSVDWQKKSDWVDQNMPKFASHEEASSRLFQQVQAEAEKAGVKISAREMLPRPTVQEGDEMGYFDRASVKLSFTEAREEDLFKWMHAMQNPKSFIGITRMLITPSPQGKTVNCEVDVTQFYLESMTNKVSSTH